MNNRCYLTFASTYFALRTEALLQESNFSFKLVPVPRQISSSCGTALQCSCIDLEAIRSTLENAGVKIEGSHELAEERRESLFRARQRHEGS